MIKRKIKQIIARHAKIQVTSQYLSGDSLFADKVVALTGGAGDIAAAIVKRMRMSGAKVVLIVRRDRSLIKEDDYIKTVQWDITDLSIADEKIKEISECFGQIDVWINNAGVMSDNDLMGDFLHATEEEWELQFNVNAKALYFATQKICQYYIEHGIKGRIVQILSIAGIQDTWKSYGLSKRMAIGITKGIAGAVASYGIVINGVAPGGVATKMIAGKMQGDDNLRKDSVPSKRLSTPEEVAASVWYLASDMASQLVGHIIVCDGGDTL